MKVIGDTLAVVTAAGQVAIDVRVQVQAAKDARSDGGAKVSLAEAEAIVKRELATLEAPVLALVKDLIG